MTILILCAALAFIALIISGCLWCYWREKKDFNNGICKECGGKLRHFDSDSQGGQGWICDKCGYTTWISWFKAKEAEK